MKDKHHITIDLPPHLHDFLYHEFKADEKGVVTLHMSNEIGQFISSMIEVVYKPPREQVFDNPIAIILPVQEWNHYILNNTFLSVPKWKQKMIANYLESLWRLRVREFFAIAYEKGFKQEKIIDAFLMSYNIKKCKATFDQIKKMDFRNRRKLSAEVSKEIQLSLRFE